MRGWSVVRGPMQRDSLPAPVGPWHESILRDCMRAPLRRKGIFNALRDRLELFQEVGFAGLELMPLPRVGAGAAGAMPAR